MASRSPRVNPKVGSKCNLILQKCLALQLQKVGLYGNAGVELVNKSSPFSGDYAEPSPHDVQKSAPFWMYDSGYLVFQGFLEANLKCFWNQSLLEAVRHLEFHGYVSPGILLVSGNGRALEIVRAAWSRNVLKPPINYTIVNVGDIEDCLIQPIAQGQFTPLPEALCWIIMDLGCSGQAAVIDAIMSALSVAFPDIQRPSHTAVYDTLAKLTAEKKIYHTSQGYFVVTPETRRLASSRRSRRNFLMSPDEAMSLVHGEMETIRAGVVTHQNIQTNLADVIMGGNANDKILYPRIPPGGATAGSSPSICSKFERRHSMRVFNNSKRFTNLQRSGSLRYITDKGCQDATVSEPDTTYKTFHRRSLSLLSRFFRRSVRTKRCPSPAGPSKKASYCDQFPPREWFNQSVKHLHSVGTQTMPPCATGPQSQLSKESLIYWEPDPYPARAQSVCSSRPPAVPPLSPSLHSTANHSLHSPSPSLSKRIASPTSKSMSSSSSGYNSLPRSIYKLHKRNGHSPSPQHKSSLLNSSNCISEDAKIPTTPGPVTPSSKPTAVIPSAQNSIIFQVSTSQGTPCHNIVTSSLTNTNADKTTLTTTTTFNGTNTTKIFLQQNRLAQQGVSSLITVENGSSSKPAKEEVTIPQGDRKPTSPQSRIPRPASIVVDDNENKERVELNRNTKIKADDKEELTRNLKNKLRAIHAPSSKENTEAKINNDRINNMFSSDKELNNIRKGSTVTNSFQEVDKNIHHLSYKNLLKNNSFDTIEKSSSKDTLSKDDSCLILDSESSYPVSKDFPMFSSLAAQNILKGISLNSIDTLVECNMAAEKKQNQEVTNVTIHTDLGKL